jgi:hypothetical protein
MRGAIVSVDILSRVPIVIPFQYNPHTLTRSFELSGSAGGGPEAGQVFGPPGESIKIDLELDATDDLEQGQGKLGVLPRIAALQVLVSPRSKRVIANAVLAAIGTIEILPPETTITLFLWGPSRVQAVIVKELSITEEAHDANLLPTRARVSLGMRVLNYGELSMMHPGYALSIANQISMEIMAKMATVGSLAGVMGAEGGLF